MMKKNSTQITFGEQPESNFEKYSLQGMTRQTDLRSLTDMAVTSPPA
jgi:hypothetical protein